MKKNIIFLDLGGVVFQSTGKSTSQIDWPTITKLNEVYDHDLNIGADKFPEFMVDYNELTSQNLTGPEFLEKLFDTLEINTELINIVKAFGDIIIVSDNYKENIHYISRRYDFDSWAKAQVYSFDYQIVKPNPKFFQRLLQDFASHEASDLILIDDSLHKLKSAAENGITGIHFQNNLQTERELKTFFDK